MGIGRLTGLKRRAVFLDRDGVINRAVLRGGLPFPPASVAQVEILPGVAEALSRLKGEGYELIVVTNQPDIGRGSVTRESVDEINGWLGARLPLDEFRMCPHGRDGECDCRKPKPGMLVDAARQRGIDLGTSFMVGDRWRDIGAGKAAGCRTFFIDYGYAETQPEAPDYRVSSLDEAAAIILETRQGEQREEG